MNTDDRRESSASGRSDELTQTAEEYLQTIYELSRDGEGECPVRICSLAEKLHVSPSSASRMAQSMALWGYIDFRRYGYITLTDKGRVRGEYLVHRRDTVRRFCAMLGDKNRERAEKVAHFVSAEMLDGMERMMSSARETTESSENNPVCDGDM